MFDAVVVADSAHATTKLLGLTLVERGRRVAVKVGARRVYVVDGAETARGLARWDDERGDAALLVIRAGDQVVHMPLVKPLLAGTHDRRIAVTPGGAYAGALWAHGAVAREVIAEIASAPATADHALVNRWADAERIVHGEIARHAATTPAERKGAANMLLRLNIKPAEDSPVSRYIYRPLSRPMTRALLHTPISANQVTIIVGIIGLVGCWLTARPGQTALIVGAALVFISGVIDGCDGEISRLRLTSSPLGAWLDTIVDELTSVVYFVAIGYHTYQQHPEAWLASSIVGGGVCYVATIYAIYYFCIVVLKAGGSQYYVGKLDIIDSAAGAALTPTPRPPPSPIVTWVLYMIRRDFINLAALALTFANAYEVIYGGILIGTIVSAVIVIPEHLRLRGQLREVARRGAAPRLLAS